MTDVETMVKEYADMVHAHYHHDCYIGCVLCTGCA